jgi:hypothetical protein
MFNLNPGCRDQMPKYHYLETEWLCFCGVSIPGSRLDRGDEAGCRSQLRGWQISRLHVFVITKHAFSCKKERISHPVYSVSSMLSTVDFVTHDSPPLAFARLHRSFALI